VLSDRILIDGPVADAYRACARLGGLSRSNLYWAVSLLRPDRRLGMSCLYAFARLVDDWADEPERSSLTASQWHNYVNDCQRRSELPADFTADGIGQLASRIQPAMSDMFSRFAVDPVHLHELIEGTSLDRQAEVQIEDQSQLDRYTYLVASTVGLACLAIWNCRDQTLHSAAVACGRALQVTNILRDVKEDAENHRVYIPRELLLKYSVDIPSCRRGSISPNWINLIHDLAGQARENFNASQLLADHLEPDARRMFLLMWRTYSQLLEKIEIAPEQVWHARVRVSRLQKFRLYLQHAMSPLDGKLAKSVVAS
jgi:15-cis-phytoene synthase